MMRASSFIYPKHLIFTFAQKSQGGKRTTAPPVYATVCELSSMPAVCNVQCACFDQYQKFSDDVLIFSKFRPSIYTIHLYLFKAKFNPIKSKAHSLLNATISSVSILQFAEERTDAQLRVIYTFIVWISHLIIGTDMNCQ